jgi:hypothetical protein
MNSSALLKSFERRIRELEFRAQARTPKHIHLSFHNGRGGTYLAACTRPRSCEVWEALQAARRAKALAENPGDETELCDSQ